MIFTVIFPTLITLADDSDGDSALNVNGSEHEIDESIPSHSEKRVHKVDEWKKSESKVIKIAVNIT